MKSTMKRVNGRSHKTVSDKAICKQCHITYNAWKFLNGEQVCYQCLGFTDETLRQFLVQNAQ